MLIEAEYLARIPLDVLAAKYGVHRDAIHRHVSKHVSDEQRAGYFLGKEKIEALAAHAAEEGKSVVDFFSILRSTLFARLDKAAAAGDDEKVARIALPLTHVLKTMARISGEMADAAARSITINNVAVTNAQILSSAPIADLQRGLLEVCARHPSARGDVVDLIRRLDTKYNHPAPQMIESSSAGEVAHV